MRYLFQPNINFLILFSDSQPMNTSKEMRQKDVDLLLQY